MDLSLVIAGLESENEAVIVPGPFSELAIRTCVCRNEGMIRENIMLDKTFQLANNLCSGLPHLWRE
jgi:hypothetical protein